MCYDIKTSLEKQLRRALLDGSSSHVSDILEKLKIFSKDEIELHHASGFSHPSMFIYTQEEPSTPRIATWGLVPEWTVDENSKSTIWNKTLNARGETIFEKPSFKESAMAKRCLIYLEGFYEHHHKNGTTFPFYIRHKEKDLFAVAGLYAEWVNPKNNELLTTFSVVTGKANAEMTRIHNNPKLKEPRMPLILDEDSQELWLQDSALEEAISNLIKPYPDNKLVAHSVASIRGTKSSGNISEATNEVRYAVLESGDQLDLF
jgi:putative SOS response-associated peptidase YedK